MNRYERELAVEIERLKAAGLDTSAVRNVCLLDLAKHYYYWMYYE